MHEPEVTTARCARAVICQMSSAKNNSSTVENVTHVTVAQLLPHENSLTTEHRC